MRYLSFLGIANDDRFCGYILDCGERNGEKCFKFYGFRMEPNTDRLCLSLHSACQARYRRVLEANTRRQANNTQPPASNDVSCCNLPFCMYMHVFCMSSGSGCRCSSEQVHFLSAGEVREPEEVQEDIRGCWGGEDLCGPVFGSSRC